MSSYVQLYSLAVRICGTWRRVSRFLFTSSSLALFAIPLSQVPLLICSQNATDWSIQFGSSKNLTVRCDWNSMISSYTCHGYSENAVQLLVLILSEDTRPTEFTLSSVLPSICSTQVDHGTDVHSLVVKSGFELDTIVCSSLVHMHATLGLIDSALKIFASMAQPDLISWNTVIMALTLNGRSFKAIDTFKGLHRRGPMPDQLSLSGVI